MDFGKAFTYMFEDPDWLRKLGIGTAMMLVGILFSWTLIGLIPFIMATGYTLDVVANVMLRKERPLPEWEDWGGFLGRGFKVVVAAFVWALPLFILLIPIVLASLVVDPNNQGGDMSPLGAAILVCGGCLTLIWGIFYALITPGIYVRIASTGRLGAAFEVGKLWAFTRNNIGNIVVAILLGIVAGMIAALIAGLGVIAIVIGLLVTIPLASLWEMLVNAHLYGQIGANSVTAID